MSRLMGFIPANVSPPCRGNYMAVFLFLIFCDQYNHKGQNRKNDHDDFIIAHTLTPLFCKSGMKTHHAETFLLGVIIA